MADPAVTESLVDRLRRLDKETDATRFGYLKLIFHATNEPENPASVGIRLARGSVLNMSVREVEELLQSAKDVFYALPALLRLVEAAKAVCDPQDPDPGALTNVFEHQALCDALAALDAPEAQT